MKLLLLLCVLVIAHRALGAEDLSNATLVVYNPNLPESKSLAEYYAARRGLPKDRLIALPCSNEEEIDRHEYDHAIAGPLRKHFQEAQLWTVEQTDEQRVIANQIRYIILIREDSIPGLLSGRQSGSLEIIRRDECESGGFGAGHARLFSSPDLGSDGKPLLQEF
jgi:hypothetical protein